MNDNGLGVAIIEGAWTKEAKDLAANLGEFEIDAFLDDGLLKEIPVIKSLIAFWKAGMSIKDRLFLRKVASFIIGCPGFTEAQVEQFVIDHWHDKKRAAQLGAVIVVILDKLDDLEKPVMLAKVFAAFVRKHISYDAFRRLAAGIDNSSIGDLKALAGEPVVPEEFAEPYPNGLVRSGFARLQAGKTWATAGDLKAEVSDLGRLFQRCILNNF